MKSNKIFHDFSPYFSFVYLNGKVRLKGNCIVTSRLCVQYLKTHILNKTNANDQHGTQHLNYTWTTGLNISPTRFGVVSIKPSSF